MSTTSKEDQRQQAQTAIDRIAQRYVSNEHRIQELDYERNINQSFGWQTAIDLLETQMVAWGRAERDENATLYDHYTTEMNRYTVDEHKEAWEDKDRQNYEYSLAYARARYAIRFRSMADALVYLQQELQDKRKAMWTYHTSNNDHDKQKGDAYIERLQLIIDQMKQTLSTD